MSLNFDQARFAMIEQQVRPWDVLDPRVLEALMTVRREDFVALAHRQLAFADLPLPLAHGEVMMKPVVEGRLLQALNLEAGEDVLEIGTGSGFVTACLARWRAKWSASTCMPISSRPRGSACRAPASAMSASRPPTPCAGSPAGSSTRSR